jgi:gamma-butyrobetaine dioxygenase
MTELFQDNEMDMIHIKWSDNSDSSYPFLWLRENDPAGFHKDTNERMTDLTSIPLDITLTKAFIKNDVLMLNWSDSANSTRYNLDWLYHHKPGKRASDPAAIKKDVGVAVSAQTNYQPLKPRSCLRMMMH